MNQQLYLDRIGFTDVVKNDFSTLEKLQHQHLFAIPFEDLDIQFGIPIILDTEIIYQKIIEGNRGGYCYELNGLFCELLKSLGFEAYLISGRITKGKNIGPEYDHLAIVVVINETKYLVDVGYGDFSLMPLAIDSTLAQFDGRNHYCIKKVFFEGVEYYSVGKLKSYDQRFHSEYFFTLQPNILSDFDRINYQKQTAGNSHFTNNLICSLPTMCGRTSLINQRLVQSIDGIKTETHIELEQLSEVLSTHFGIDFDVIDYFNDLKFVKANLNLLPSSK